MPNNPQQVPIAVKILAVFIALGILFAVTATNLWENNDAGWTCVKQAAFSGELSVIPEPGVFWQGFGKVDRYKQAVTISFGHGGEDGSADAGPIDVQFNDAGTAKVYGNARFDMPLDTEAMKKMHKKYRSYDHVVRTLLEPWVVEVCVLTAGMFSSEDTYGGNKAEYVRLCEDQLRNGKFLTDVREEESEDPITKERRRVKRVTIRKDAQGKEMRMESPLDQYGIKASQFLMTENFDYDPQVEEQIKAQRDNFLKTNTARAEAQKASQDAITARAKGEAEVTRVKYEELVKKEQATVEAQRQAEVAKINAEKDKTVAEVDKLKAEIEARKKLAVAELNKQTAEQDKLAAIAKGEGEARARQLVLEADGALQIKLETWLKANMAYAEAIGNYRGNIVPQVVTGGGSGQTNGAQDLIALLMAKTAKDLSVDITAGPPVKAAQGN